MNKTFSLIEIDMVRLLKFLSALLLALCCVSAAWSQPTSPRRPGEFSCCVDANGRKSCGEILPSQCVGRAHTVYSRAGNPIRHVRADDEKALLSAQEAEQKKAQEMEEERQRRRDAIRSAYSSMQEIDQQQSRIESGLKKEIANAQQHISAANKRLGELQAQLPPESTDDKKPQTPISAELTESIRNEHMEIKYQNELINLKRQELERVRAKYESDRREYRELFGNQ